MTIDLERLKEKTRAAWSLGNYPELAKLIEPAAVELVRASSISPGQDVLDVAAGNGNVAVLAARAGASVVASDLTPAMVELGRERSRAEGLDVEWVEADAEELPFEHGQFDCVTSAFGAMFAPRPELVARELLRVLRPGGTLGMANWTPGGFMGRMFAVQREYEPLPEGVPEAVEWGRREAVSERLDGLAADVRCETRDVPYRFASGQAMRDFFEENAGPSRAARESLSAEDREALARGVAEVTASHNAATDGSVAIDAEYLLVVARKRSES